MPRTIGARLLIASAIALTVSFLVLAVAVPVAARRYETDRIGERLASEARLLADLARSDLIARNDGALDALAQRATGDAVRITLIAPDGTVVGESHDDRRSMDNHADRAEVAAALAGREGRAIRSSATIGRDLLYVAVPVESGGAIVGVARTAFPLATLDALAAQLVGAVLVAGLVGAGAAGLVSFLLERAITRPLVELTRRAASSGAGVVSFSVGGPVEVRRLGTALETMAADARSARRTIEQERDRLATLVESLSDAVVIVDAEERIRLANPAAERMLGTTPLHGRRLVDCARDHEIFTAVSAARHAGEGQSQIERDAPRRFVRVVARRLDEQQVLLALQDLTIVYRSEAIRREFVANVSHELRTPIASLAAMAETLDDGALDDPVAARDFIHRMQAELADLAQLVEELLTLARVESGSDPLRLAPLPPQRPIDEAVRRLTTLADRARVELVVERPVPASPVLADADRLGQVLSNLVHNAVKFTPPGGRVTLGARDEEGSVRFFVRDTGAGMDETVVPRVFERFYKSDRSRAGGGTGLGLAIAKHIVLAHGGTIEAESAGPDRGSTFTFTVPRA